MKSVDVARKLNHDHLDALMVCVDEGTFDGAAAALRVTPSAISQRIKALEQAVGQIVVIRSVPVQPTEIGAVLLRSARQRALLDRELERALAKTGKDGGVIDLPVAVNADSLATWFTEVLASVGEWGDMRLRLFIEDQDHSARLLRDGAVVGAVTASSKPVQGCAVHELGVMRYQPRVAQTLLNRVAAETGLTINADGGSRISHEGSPQLPQADLARLMATMPTLCFNERDDMQRRALRQAGFSAPRVEHVIGSAEGFVDAIAAGLGWGMAPEGLERPGIVPVPGLPDVDVPLFWQCWRLDTPALARLGDEVISAAYQLR